MIEQHEQRLKSRRGERNRDASETVARAWRSALIFGLLLPDGLAAALGTAYAAGARLAPGTPLAPLVIGLALMVLVLAFYAMRAAYRLAEALESKWPVLWAVLVAAPGSNLLALTALKLEANAYCQDRGVDLSFFGS